MNLDDIINLNPVDIYDNNIFFDPEAGVYLNDYSDGYIPTALIVIDITDKDTYNLYHSFFINYLNNLGDAYNIITKHYDYSLTNIKPELKEGYDEILYCRKQYKEYAISVARNLGLLITDDVDIVYPECLTISDDWFDYVINYVRQLHIYCHKQTKFYEIMKRKIDN